MRHTVTMSGDIVSHNYSIVFADRSSAFGVILLSWGFSVLV